MVGKQAVYMVGSRQYSSENTLSPFTMADDNKLTLSLVVVVGLLAVVAIIISAVSLSKNMPPTITIDNPTPSGGGRSASQGQGAQQPVIVQEPSGPMASNVQSRYRPPTGSNGRIYSVFAPHDYGSHSFFTQEGYLSGFGVGLLDLVCKEAEIDCRLVWDLSINCWDNSFGYAVGGKGLHSRWYDACMGWYTTIERTLVFHFSEPYLKKPGVYFFVLPTKSFDTSKENILKSKILFINSWGSDEKCMARVTGAIISPQNFIYADNTHAAIDLLHNGYDAIFCTTITFIGDLKMGILKTAGPEYSCMLAGDGIMSRKDSDFPVHWNRGFMKLKNSGRFKKYCETANAEHINEGIVECVNSY